MKPLSLVLGCVVGLASSIQAQTDFVLRRVPLPYMVLVVLWDSSTSVTLLASPTLASSQRSQSGTVTTLHFDFDTLRTWLPTARLFVDSAETFVDPDTRRSIGTRVEARKTGAIVFGFDPVSKRHDPYLLTIIPREGPSWTLEASPDQLAVLLDALTWVLTHSTPVSPWLPNPGDGPALIDRYDTPPRLTKRANPHYPPLLLGTEGRVWARFVVTSEGRVDPTTVRILLSDNEAFDAAAREALAQERFHPGSYQGHPSPVRVFQIVTFRSN